MRHHFVNKVDLKRHDMHRPSTIKILKKHIGYLELLKKNTIPHKISYNDQKLLT